MLVLRYMIAKRPQSPWLTPRCFTEQFKEEPVKEQALPEMTEPSQHLCCLWYSDQGGTSAPEL